METELKEAMERERMRTQQAEEESSEAAAETVRSRGGSRWGAQDKRKRWSVCGGEKRADLDLETIWEEVLAGEQSSQSESAEEEEEDEEDEEEEEGERNANSEVIMEGVLEEKREMRIDVEEMRRNSSEMGIVTRRITDGGGKALAHSHTLN
jgi:hypothetical protein